MERLEVSGAVRPMYGSLGVKCLTGIKITIVDCFVAAIRESVFALRLC